jgi:glycosyltransferase involved in cell wall biosynthesis
MRIVVLAHNLRASGGLSVGRNLVDLLPKFGPEHSYLILVPKGLGYATHNGRKNVAVNEVPLMSFIERIRFDLFSLPKLIKNFNPDMILGLGNLGLRKPPCKQAILFHNPHLIYSAKYYPREVTIAKLKNYLLKKRLKQCLRYTDIVFCQTPVACRRFARMFKYPEDQIKIMPNAVSEFAKISREEAGTPQILRNTNCFNLFFLSKFLGHKNLEILIDVFRDYREKLRDVRCITTVASQQHPNAAKFLSDINKYNLQEHIINVGPLKQTELAGYFYNCDALLFPTLLESFSATYLEAMYFGLPILTSDLDFAHYICGEAALYFDPWNVDDILKKILILKNKSDLRETLISMGKIQLCRFSKSWREITAGVIGELENLMGQTRPEQTT